MLKLFFTTLFLYSSLILLKAQLPSNFPLYHEVVDYVVEQGTSYINLDRTTKLNILKKPQGFWLTVETYQEDAWQKQSKQLIWSEKEGFVKELLIAGDENERTIEYTNFRKKPLHSKLAAVDEYNINRFFGDKNWTDQTITYYKRFPATTSEDYYSLGRAHSYKSAQYLRKHGKYHLLHQDPTLLDALIIHGKKAATYFKKVHELEPKFKTIVGNIYTKYCNEILTLNIRLASLGLKEKALKTVVGKELYTKETLTFSENSLKSCPPNAILFTYGDNDTYPLLYLQQAKNIRTDVLIVNESLLNLDYYIDHLRDQAYYNKSYLELDLAPSAYQDNNNQYILLEQDFEKDTWPVQELIHLLESNEAGIRTARTYGFVLGEYDQEAVTLICSHQYLTRSALLLLIILENHHKTRPIIFSPSYGYSNGNFTGATGIKKNLHIRGINHQFQYTKADNATLSKKQALENFDLFIDQLQWRSFETIKEGEKPSFYATTLNFSRTIDALIEHKEVQKAKALQNNWYAHFHKIEKIADIIRQMSFIEQFYALKQKDRGNVLLKQYMTYLETGDVSDAEITLIKADILPRIKKILAKHHNADLSKQLKNVKAKYQQ